MRLHSTWAILSPVDGTEVAKGETVLFEVSAEDAIAVAQVELLIDITDDGIENPTISVGVDSEDPYNFTYTFADDVDFIRVTAVATDSTSQSTPSSPIDLVFVNHLPPAVPTNIVAVPESGTRLNNNVTLSWDASIDSDNVPMGATVTYDLRYTIDGTTFTDIVSGIVETSHVWNVSDIDDTTTLEIQVRASDGLLNSDWGSLADQEVDNGPPSNPSVIADTNLIQLPAETTTGFTLSAQDARRYRVDSGEWVDFSTDSSLGVRVENYDLGSDIGVASIMVDFEDMFGNISAASADVHIVSDTAEVITAGLTIDASNLVDYENTNLIVSGSGTVLAVNLATTLNLNSLTVINGASVTHPDTTTNQEYRLDLNVVGDVFIEAGSSIDTTARGYTRNRTLGNSAFAGSYTGGSHGGYGGYAIGNGRVEAYGNPYWPVDLGSGSGSASDSDGGGAIHLRAQSLVVDGAVRSDGQGNTSSLGVSGAGGSILLEVSDLSGAGSVSANGGDSSGSHSYASGGGGGRIAVYYDSLSGGFDTETQIAAYGGDARNPGGPGTIYLESSIDTAGLGELIYDAGDHPSQFATRLRSYPGGAVTGVDAGLLELTNSDTAYPAYDPFVATGLVGMWLQPDITVNAYYYIVGNTGTTIKVEDPEGTFATNASVGSTYRVVSGANKVTLRNTARVESESLWAKDTLSIQSDSSLSSLDSSTTEEFSLLVDAGTIEVWETAAIDTTARGYTRNRTLGNSAFAGSYTGGSHGGYGGYAIGNGRVEAYGNPYWPVDLGSGSGSASESDGGGAIHLRAQSLVVDGAVRSDGQGNTSSLGVSGAGGSVLLEISNLSGTGVVSANGGDSPGGHSYASGGGGGRIAVYYDSLSGGFDVETQVTAYGGAAYNPGGPGTIYLESSGDTEGLGELIYDAGDRSIQFATRLRSYPGGIVTGVDAGLLELTNSNAVYPTYESFVANGLVGMWLQPDIAVDAYYYIVDNNGTTIQVADPEGTFATNANVGSTYRVVSGANRVTLRNTARVESESLWVKDTLSIESNSNLSSLDSSTTEEFSLLVDAGTIEVKETAAIDTTARGYVRNRTLGNSAFAGSYTGGSHGGYGGYAIGNGRVEVYGNPYWPVDLGSGSGSASDSDGGGAIHLRAQSLVVDGAVRSDGQGNTSSLGVSGAGGSVLLEVNNLSGTGVVSANGGDSPGGHSYASGGGGGRIAVYYDSLSGGFDIETQIAAYGGDARNPGGPGTIYLESIAQNGIGDLIIDNGGVMPQFVTPIDSPITGGTIDNVSTSPNASFTDLNASFVADSRIGEWVQPDVNLDYFYLVQSNTTDTLEVIDDANATFSQVADIGDTYRGVLLFDNVTISGNAAVSSATPLYYLSGLTGIWGGSAGSLQVTLNPPIASLEQLQWSVISDTQYQGIPFPVTVTASDQFGNTINTFAGSVALSGIVTSEIGEGTESWTYPLDTNALKSRTQVIYHASEIEGEGDIVSLTLDIATVPEPMNTWTIRMKHTSKDEYATNDEWETDAWTIVYQNDVSMNAAGLYTFIFSTPFDYNGTENLMIDFSFNNSSYGSSGLCERTDVASNRSLTNRSYSSSSDPLTWDNASIGGNLHNYIPNIELEIEVDSQVTPAAVSNFVSGVWSGYLTVNQSWETFAIQAFAQDDMVTTISNQFEALATDLTLSLPSIVKEGETDKYGTVSLPASTPADITLSLASLDTTELIVPASITIPAGSDSATFPLTIPDDGAMDSIETVGVSVSAPNMNDDSVVIEVIDISMDYFSVIFDLGTEGTRIGGGDLEQLIIGGNSAIEPEVRGVVANRRLTGWDQNFDSVIGDMTIHGIYGDSLITINLQPADQSVNERTSGVFEVDASSSSSLSYQWYEGLSGDISNPVPGATGPLLVTLPLAANTSFWVRVSDADSFVDSDSAAATILPQQGYDLFVTDNRYNGHSGSTYVAGDVVAVAEGGYHRLYIKNDGTLWAMGSNNEGQLGDGTNNDQSTPVSITNDVVAVAAGDNHSLYVKSDGALWAMGRNFEGQLGDGTNTENNTAVYVGSDVVAVAAGNDHSLYVKSDGTLWAMGDNYGGQLGDGTDTDRNTAVHVDDGVVAVAAGDLHSLYIKSDGTLWAMGYNGEGQLGNGAYDNQYIPSQVADNVVAAAGGSDHSLYVKTDNTLWGMGSNYGGQLGDSAGSSSLTTAEQIAGDVVLAAAAADHSLYIKTDNTLWGTGGSNYDAYGPYDSRNTPEQIAGNVVSVSTGSGFDAYLVKPPQVTFDLNPHGTRTGGGELIQSVTNGASAVAPEFDVAQNWMFTGWDTDFANVTTDLTVTAQYFETSDAVTYLPFNNSTTDNSSVQKVVAENEVSFVPSRFGVADSAVSLSGGGDYFAVLMENALIADSTNDFSNQQGSNGWFYGYYPFTTDGDSTYNSSDDFVEMPFYDSNPGFWYLDMVNEASLRIFDESLHPSTTRHSVRSWSSNVAGQIRITGLVKSGDDQGGNGTTARIYNDSTLLATWDVGATDPVGYTIDLLTSVSTGSLIDYLVDSSYSSNGVYNMDYDTTVFTSQIRAENGITNSIFNNSFTLSFWLKDESPDSSRDYVFLCKGTVGGNDALWGRKTTLGEIEFALRNISGEEAVVTYPKLLVTGAGDAVWHHYAIICDRSQNTLTGYLDGTSIDSSTTTAGLVISNSSELILGNNSTLDSGWVGQMDDFLILDSAIAPEQVQELAGRQQ